MRLLLPALLLAALLAPSLAMAHGLPGVQAVPAPVKLGTPPGFAGAVPMTNVGVPLETLFAPEVAVTLLAQPRSDDAAWDSAPTTEYDLRFVCPPPEAAGTTLPGSEQVPVACPAYVLDTEDIMAQPDLAIDPRDDTLIAFHAMHGGPGLRTPLQDPVPDERSRDNVVHQPHTLFQSKTGGVEWDDNRYYAPDNLATSSAEVFGQDNALALDPEGKVTLASLYAYRTAQGDEPRYVTYLWQSGRIKETVDYNKNYVARDVPEGRGADSLDLVWHPGAEEMVALWRTTGSEGPRVHAEHKGEEGQWTAWDPAAAAIVGACDALSNGVAIGQQVVFACSQGSDTRVWGLGSDWNVTDLGNAPLHGLTSLRLASAEEMRDGGIVIAGSGEREGRTLLTVVWGVAGVEWGRPTEHGSALSQVGGRPGGQLIEAHLTALVVKGSSGTAHFLVQERFTGGSAADGRVFAKSYGVVQSTGRFLGTFGLGYGDPQSRATVPVTVSGNSVGGFHDSHDSLLVMKGKLGEERLFVAFGDYGYVRFAEVVEVEPTPPLFPPIAAPAAIPTMTAATSPVLVAAAAGALSMAAVSRIVLARSKKSVEVQA